MCIRRHSIYADSDRMGVGQIIGIVLFVAALAANLIAIATPGWKYSAGVSTGLFELISGSTALESNNSST